jgi:uncharacterized protein
MKKTVEEVESQLENALSNQLQDLLKPLVPAGYRARFYLYDRVGTKKRKNASAENWSPASDQIQIWFSPAVQGASADHTTARPVKESQPSNAVSGSGDQHDDPISDLIRALNLAEHRPGFGFVSLKWFRDSVLSAGCEWAKSESTRQDVLRDAIARRFILTNKVPNPKDPQFPVTAIRLNRLLPEVQAILGTKQDTDTDFHPVEIRGEPMSATIIRERRQ